MLLGGGTMTRLRSNQRTVSVRHIAERPDPLWLQQPNCASRPFEPRLAAILATVAWAAVQNPPDKDKGKDKAKDKAKEKPVDAPLPELTLAHPNDAVARTACQSIQMQLAREGIPIQLREFTADELLAGKVDCDLRYAELAVWEPITDAPLILGPHGLAGDLQSPYLETALRNLAAATNWKDVALALGRTARNRPSRVACHSALAIRQLLCLSREHSRRGRIAASRFIRTSNNGLPVRRATSRKVDQASHNKRLY